MPDEEVKILIKVAGQKDLNNLVDKIKEQTATVNDLTRAQKAYAAVRKNEIVGTKEYARIAAAEVAVKEEIAKANQSVLTANGKMMQSYFKLGTQIRSGLLPLLDGLPTAFRPILGAIDGITNKLSIMQAQGVSKIDAIKQAFSGGAGLTIGVGFAITAITLLINKMSDAKAEAKKFAEDFNKSMKSIIDNLVSAGLITKGQALNEAQLRMESKQREFDTLRRMTRVGMVRTGRVSETGKEEFKQGLIFIETEVEFEARRNKLLEELSALASEVKGKKDDVLKAEKETTKEMEKQKNLTDFMLKVSQKRMERLQYAAKKRREGQDKQPFDPISVSSTDETPLGLSMIGTDALSSAANQGKRDMNTRVIDLTEWNKNLKKGKDTLESMADLTSLIAANLNRSPDSFISKLMAALSIIVKMMDTIKSAQSTGGNPALGILTGMLGITGLFSFARGGWIREPVVGIGTRTGSGYTIAENQPEYVSPMLNQSFGGGNDMLASEIRALRQDMAGGRWKMKGRDMVYTYDTNKNILNRRTY